MTPLEFSIVASFGLLSGLHCVQMCGPIVLSYSLSMAKEGSIGQGVWRAHLAYNAGRILTYMLLGGVAGALGRTIGLLGRMAGVASGARIAAGAAMIVTGILVSGIVPKASLVQIQSRGITGRLSGSIGRLITGTAVRGKFALGLMLGFLPCGLIYAALLKAVETSGAAAGALTMLAFGLGTAVSLVSIGFASSLFGNRLGRWTNRLAGFSVMLFGLILLLKGLSGKPICHG